MNDLEFAILLSFIQGITEFLPISSSGHLVILPTIFGNKDKGQIIDVAAHAGTLIAVCLYLRFDLLSIFKSIFNFKEKNNNNIKLFYLILLGTFPLIIIGFIINQLNLSFLRLALTVALSNLFFALCLLYCDKTKISKKLLINDNKNFSWNKMSYLDAVLIGFSQIFSLIPGASRSGVTISMARLLGYDRITSARFSLFLSIPAISGASLLKIIEISNSDQIIEYQYLIFIIFMSFLFAYLAINWMMKFLLHANYNIFVWYRIILGSLIIILLYFN